MGEQKELRRAKINAIKKYVPKEFQNIAFDFMDNRAPDDQEWKDAKAAAIKKYVPKEFQKMAIKAVKGATWDEKSSNSIDQEKQQKLDEQFLQALEAELPTERNTLTTNLIS